MPRVTLPTYLQLLKPFIGSWLINSCFYLRSIASTQQQQTTSAPLFQALYQRYPEVEVDVQRSGAELFAYLETHSTTLKHLEVEQRQQLFQQLHAPVYAHFKRLYGKHRLSDARRPLFIGLSAPQGCGKTSLTAILCDLFRHEGISCISMSVDDFYLPAAQQDALSKRYALNPLLEFRGNAGTHDLQLAMSTMHALLNMRRGSSSSSPTVRIPRYDKSLRDGRGDRVVEQHWQQVSEPVDVVLLEGWLLGFNPLDSISRSVAASTDMSYLRSTNSSSCIGGELDDNDDDNNQCPSPWTEEQQLLHWRSLVEVNELMRPYEALNFMMDSWLVLAVQSPTAVYRWRAGAEQLMRAHGRAGLTDLQVEAFVARFMPAYSLYLGGLYSDGPQRRKGGAPVLKITVADDRFPLKVELIG